MILRPVIAALLVVGVSACADAPNGAIAHNDLVTLTLTGPPDVRSLRLDPAPGARINALLPPTVEFSDRERLLLTSASLTSDSSYFVDAPTVRIARARGRRGVLRASVCPAAVRACLFVELPVVIP